jgi:fatty-acid desaturase
MAQPTLMYGRKFQHGLNVITAVAMTAFHIGAVAALFYIDVGAMLTALLLWVMAGSLGIGMSYHRLLTHRGYKTYKWVEYFLTWCGTLALEGGPIFWVATHRIHHQKSDREGDPHSPREGTWWSHMGWILLGQGLHQDSAVLARYVPDLSKDRGHVWLSKWHWTSNVIVGLVLLAFGGIPYVLWGIFFRTTWGLHSTWLVNSATHLWGSRRFKTRDDSTNNWWVALLTFGEGWHNNHHAHPTSARHGLAWYELDVNWIFISTLRRLGLAWDVKLARIAQEVSYEENDRPVIPEEEAVA